MVTTVTLNASIDKAYYMKEAIENGTVMRVMEVRNVAGGKGLNVAKAVHRTGTPVKATGFIGGFNGQYLVSLAEKEGLQTDFEKVDGETRSCINILDPKFGSTEYLEPGFSLNQEDIDRFLKRFPEIIKDSDVVTLSGSAPQGIEKDIYKILVGIIRDAGKRAILDTSGDYLKKALESDAKPFMIKPNQDEIEQLLGEKAADREGIIALAKKLHAGGIPWVVISLGGDGALIISDEGVFKGTPPKITPKNTVGCGDSMVGAFAVAVERDYGPAEALKFAISVSSAAAMWPDTGGFDPEVQKGFYEKSIVEKLRS